VLQHDARSLGRPSGEANLDLARRLGVGRSRSEASRNDISVFGFGTNFGTKFRSRASARSRGSDGLAS
jgi:hypothetical protein